ncbi:hypothetical protein [Lactococcus allomyrinae]|uniref:DUF2442 domain-containing protein n=1 Tax=Lactococcus allomyrinae TaxID=2419773 RepID=A0A387BAZ0_9LACT|nr:hypothetical protein [Lactococcus allomyrinae]AYG01035.1 hypothetical protein D7I46_08015 [Lactococcus allomyrinae]
MDFPKVTKAEMLPNVRLRLEFNNGEVRYLPVNDQLELIIKPFHKETLKKTYGLALFLGGVNSWMGNEIKIQNNGDIQLNQKLIPAEVAWKYSLKHLNSEWKEPEEQEND